MRTLFQQREKDYRETAIRKGYPIAASDIVFGCKEYCMSEGIFYAYHVVVKRNNTLVKYHKRDRKVVSKEIAILTKDEIRKLKKYPYVIDDITDVLRQLRSGQWIY